MYQIKNVHQKVGVSYKPGSLRVTIPDLAAPVIDQFDKYISNNKFWTVIFCFDYYFLSIFISIYSLDCLENFKCFILKAIVK